MSANPFTPVFGNEPPILAGRSLLIQDVLNGLGNGPGDPNRATIFTGPRGSGKTVLLSRIAADAEGMGWIAIHATALDGMLDQLVEQLQDRAEHILAKKPTARITSIQAAGYGLSRTVEQESVVSWRTKMGRYLDELAEQEVGLLITVDEVTSKIPEMITLVDSFQHFVREKRNVALVMAGLPNNVIQMFQHDRISFLRRAFRRDLGSVSLPEVRVAMRRTAELGGRSISDDALMMAAQGTQGFPFMIQLVGYHMFNLSSGTNITIDDVQNGIEIAHADMEHMVIDATIRELTDKDLEFLRAMAQDNQVSRISDITTRLGITPANAGYHRRRLIELGIISATGRGKVAMNIPLLHDWLRNQAADFPTEP